MATGVAMVMHKARQLDRLPEPARRDPDWNSYCLVCARWYFGERLRTCDYCHSMIFRWIPTADLRLFATRSPLARL